MYSSYKTLWAYDVHSLQQQLLQKQTKLFEEKGDEKRKRNIKQADHISIPWEILQKKILDD